jgi:hypothetical protein
MGYLAYAVEMGKFKGGLGVIATEGYQNVSG